MKKYLVYGGHIRSISDGDRHYIPAHRVAELFRVSRDECIFVPSNEIGFYPPKGLLVLQPNTEGNYDLKQANPEPKSGVTTL